jgi:hypothetical protein
MGRASVQTHFSEGEFPQKPRRSLHFKPLGIASPMPDHKLRSDCMILSDACAVFDGIATSFYRFQSGMAFQAFIHHTEQTVWSGTKF